MATITVGQHRFDFPDDLWNKYATQVQNGTMQVNDALEHLADEYDRLIGLGSKWQGGTMKGQEITLDSLSPAIQEARNALRSSVGQDFQNGSPIAISLASKLKDPNWNFAKSSLYSQDTPPGVGTTAVNSPKPAAKTAAPPPTQTQTSIANPSPQATAQTKPSILPPMVNLQPGQSGDTVKQLQNWLISQGYSIPAGATGYYGDQTKNALTQWQKANSVDVAGNPGYFGPHTISKVQQLSAKAGNPIDPSGAQNNGQSTSSSGAVTSTGLDSGSIEGLNYLFTPDQVSQMSPTDQKQWAMVGEFLKKQADLGKASDQSSAQALNDAYQAALKDPTIAAKYGDIQASDRANFFFNISQMSDSAKIKEASDKAVFDAQKKQLDEKSAEAGQAYSGFRRQAKELLATEQGGVVNSTLSDYNSRLRSMVEPLEKYYGSSRFSSMFGSPTVSYMGQNAYYSPVGNLTGSEGFAKESDVLSRASELFKGISYPKTQ